ncbi:MAG: dihydroneopterin triphosphate 2'-epimerase [Rhodospirillaceae bacterium]|nr:dihydroneopterin triphosphate 2'-epimerase [Rhodospirillaceae bacterium]|tara:strand:- start:2148 stop:2588 length:441 start_codon:yes stop_codon:yes gene_type:complete
MLGEMKIKNLRLRTFIGFNEEEKIHKQDIVINMRIIYDTNRTEITDSPSGLNYKTHFIKKIIAFIENNRFNLLESLVYHLCKLIDHRFQNDKIYQSVLDYEIEVDKIGALRYADSVSVKFQKKDIKKEDSLTFMKRWTKFLIDLKK